MVLDHAKLDAMMLWCCGWLPGCCYAAMFRMIEAYAVASMFSKVARWAARVF